jgi:hypothetical protein
MSLLQAAVFFKTAAGQDLAEAHVNLAKLFLGTHLLPFLRCRSRLK